MPALRRSRYLLLGLLAAGLRAEQPVSSAPPPPEDAISAAKRDYDLIKGAKSSALDPQKIELPRVEAPAMHLSNDEMAGFLDAEASQKKKAQDLKNGKTGNWLVDAMNDKKPGSRDGAKPATAAVGEEDEPATTLAAESKEPSRDERKSRGAASAQTTAAADNPLTTYMSAWMTPKDLELLKVKPADSVLAAAPERGAGGPAETGMPDGLVRSDNGVTAVDAAAAGSPSTERRANPYLAEFSPDAGSQTAIKELLSPPAPTGAAPPPAASLLAPVPGDPGPAKSEPAPLDLLKAPSDAKYFPQLKRF